MDNKLELNVLPEDEKNWSIKFAYDDISFEIESKGHNSSFATISIKKDGELEEGEITGLYSQNEGNSEVVFRVDEVTNKGVLGAEGGPPAFSSGHIKYLIAESITQILLNGKVDRWISSEGTNDGSNRMYMHIEEVGRVNVEMVQNKETGQYHYEIKRKNQVDTEKV